MRTKPVGLSLQTCSLNVTISTTTQAISFCKISDGRRNTQPKDVFLCKESDDPMEPLGDVDEEKELDSVQKNIKPDLSSRNDPQNGHQYTYLPNVEICQEEVPTSLRYGLRETPPVVVTIMAALQQILVSVSGCLSTSMVVAEVACVPFDHPVRSRLFCTTVFMSGFCTMLQTAFGVRLPIFQGPSSSFLVPLLALKSDPTWTCRAPSMERTEMNQTSTSANVSSNTSTAAPGVDVDNEIHWRLQEMSGSLMLASLFEIIVAASGLLNVLLRIIGPITVACTISLIGVSLYKLPIIWGEANYPIAIASCAIILIFILYLENVTIPLPRIGKKNKTGPRPRFPIFVLLPIILAVILMWIIAAILTFCGVFTDDKTDPAYLARVDAKTRIISSSGWFHITYPGQFGPPSMSIALVLGFLVAVLSSSVESVGDYYAAHKATEVHRPPSHAISRGILVEGIGSVISGTVGAGHATTSYSTNIAVIKVSKTASRIVMYVAGMILIVLSVLGKAGAAFTTIPNPILGGLMMSVIGTLMSIGISNLNHVDMTSSRNILIVGVSFMSGIVVPFCLEHDPNIINTGNMEADRVLRVILGSPMFLGGILALILDSTAPGSRKSRGLPETHESSSDDKTTTESSAHDEVYSWPVYPRLAKKFPFLNYLPFMPDEREDKGKHKLVNNDGSSQL